jgi:type II secretory pathway component GspD/PulD (secretin)
MKANSDATASRAIPSVQMLAAFALALAFFAPGSIAQAQPADAKPSTKPAPEPAIEQTFFLHNVTQQSELADIQTDVRNMLTNAKIYSVASQYAISMKGTAEDIELAQKLITELDRPRKIYRLTYTITEMDSGKKTGAQSFSLIVASEEKTTFKQGSRVPIVTGSYDTSSTPNGAETQVQYLDVGLNIQASVGSSADGLMLRTKVEQTTVADEKSGVGAQDPIVRQTVLDGASTLSLDKPLVLGSLDIPGSTRKQEIAVIAELVK